MRISDITPLLITWNEAPNIERCLERLKWAPRIVVIDSGSTDETLAICGKYANVDVVHRPFDSFASQCNFGLQQVRTPWVLSMDADYIVPKDFAQKVADLSDEPAGYSTGFRYCIYGRPLRGTLYPPRTTLYRRSQGNYQNIGHGHRVIIDGRVEQAPFRIDHDDQKSLDRWLDSQRKYARQEAVHLTDGSRIDLNKADRIRLAIWPAVPVVFLYTLIWKLCLFDGWAGWFYALQRVYAELLLSLFLLDKKLTPNKISKES